jgi:hypothetical protein
MQRKWAIPAILVVTSSCGCIPYVLPSLVMTRPMNLSEVAEEVHVFRVDISAKSGAPCYGQEEYSLSEVSLIGGVAPPQLQAGLDRGIIIIGVALNYHFHYHDGVHVRLYRPGYELVQFKSWEFGKKVTWTRCSDLVGRERAIDELLAAPGTVSWCQMSRHKEEKSWGVPGALRSAAYSKKHRAALEFIGAEYERLAADEGCSEEDRRRLSGKAEAVRTLR